MAGLRLVASDLDGTLLRGDSTLSPRTAAALRATRAAGIRFVAATARPVRVLADVVGDDLLDAAICANGAVRYDPTAGAVVTHPVPPPVATFVMTEIDRLVPGAAFAVETGARVLQEPRYTHRPTLDLERYTVPTRDELVAEPPVKIMVLLPDADAEGAWTRLAPSLSGVVSCTWSSRRGILEIGAPGVSKARALAELCTEWSITPSQVAAFGDARNDIDMLSWAGTGYAVANAAPEVLLATRHHAPSNDEDGVARTLERLLAGVTAQRSGSPAAGGAGP